MQVRGFAPIGMLKFWNIADSAFYTQYSNIPLFHHSMRLIKTMTVIFIEIPINCEISAT